MKNILAYGLKRKKMRSIILGFSHFKGECILYIIILKGHMFYLLSIMSLLQLNTFYEMKTFVDKIKCERY